MDKLTKVRFIEPGHTRTDKGSLLKHFAYNTSICNPSTGLITLTTIVKDLVDDTLMYSEALSEIAFDDIYDANVVFISINTYNALRGYAIAAQLREHSQTLIVFGGMHASLNYPETIAHCDYVLLGDGDESIVEFIHALKNDVSITFPGVVYKKNQQIVATGKRNQPTNIDTVPNRYLVYDYARLAIKFDTLWPQVHASRGCQHSCAYCTIIRHFGRKIRKRRPESVVEDIRQGIAFHKRRGIPRINNGVWITDDNFAGDKKWAKTVLRKIIAANLGCTFAMQARSDIADDDEMLILLRRAGFVELSLGIEFLHDDALHHYQKKVTSEEIVRAIKKIQSFGIGVRGLFIVGSDNDAKGIGEQIYRFVVDNHLTGALIQSMFFAPGTPFFDQHEHTLIHKEWNKYDGNVVHYPAKLTPYELQQEIIHASQRIYSIRRLLGALFRYCGLQRILFIGDFFWHINVRKKLRKELPKLQQLTSMPRDVATTEAIA